MKELQELISIVGELIDTVRGMDTDSVQVEHGDEHSHQLHDADMDALSRLSARLDALIEEVSNETLHRTR